MDTFGERGRARKETKLVLNNRRRRRITTRRRITISRRFLAVSAIDTPRKRSKKVEESGFPRELIATEKFGARLFADFPGVLTSRETRAPSWNKRVKSPNGPGGTSQLRQRSTCRSSPTRKLFCKNNCCNLRPLSLSAQMSLLSQLEILFVYREIKRN